MNSFSRQYPARLLHCFWKWHHPMGFWLVSPMSWRQGQMHFSTTDFLLDFDLLTSVILYDDLCILLNAIRCSKGGKYSLTANLIVLWKSWTKWIFRVIKSCNIADNVTRSVHFPLYVSQWYAVKSLLKGFYSTACPEILSDRHVILVRGKSFLRDRIRQASSVGFRNIFHRQREASQLEFGCLRGKN